MNIMNRKSLIGVVAVLFAISFFAYAVFAKQPETPIDINESVTTNQNEIRAQQIAEMSQWDTAVIMELYNRLGDWDKLVRNVFVYKKLYSLAEGLGVQAKLLELIKNNDAQDLYVVYEYFVSKGLAIAGIEEALELKSRGESWEVILAKFTERKEYKNYKVLSKENLRELLGQGYLPEDILQADSIASSLDLTLQKVLTMKTAENTWDSIAKALGYEGEKQAPQFSLTVAGTTYDEEQELANLISDSKQKTEKQKKDVEKKVKSEFKLTEAQMKEYLDQGFNQWEVRNAYKLAKANDITPQEVLNNKKEGKSWEEILALYPKK